MERVIALGAEPAEPGPVVRKVVDSQGARDWLPPAVLP